MMALDHAQNLGRHATLWVLPLFVLAARMLQYRPAVLVTISALVFIVTILVVPERVTTSIVVIVVIWICSSLAPHVDHNDSLFPEIFDDLGALLLAILFIGVTHQATMRAALESDGVSGQNHRARLMLGFVLAIVVSVVLFGNGLFVMKPIDIALRFGVISVLGTTVTDVPHVQVFPRALSVLWPLLVPSYIAVVVGFAFIITTIKATRPNKQKSR